MKDIIYAGLFSTPYGYGEAARGYKRIIEEQGWPIECYDLAKQSDWLKIDSIGVENKTLILHKRPVSTDLSPYHKSIIERAKKLVYMTVWECNRIPSSWQEEIDKSAEIIVPSTYSSLFLNKEKKTHILPHLIEQFTHDMKFDQFIDSKINILVSMSQLTDRKGIDLIIPAYHNVRKDLRDQCNLIVKGTKGIGDYLKSNTLYFNSPKIRVIQDYLSDENMERLFNTSDIYFSPNRGEGFGIDIVRYGLTGKPVVATQLGGYTDVFKKCDKCNPYLIECDWDYAYSANTYRDLDMTGIMWPSPSIKQCTLQLEKAIEFTLVNKERIRKLTHVDFNDNIYKYNLNIIETFKQILENI